MTENFRFNEQNRIFWNEICGTTFAELNRINLEDMNSITLFDKLYFEFYPYLKTELLWVLEGARNCIEVGLGAGAVSRFLASNCDEYMGLDVSDYSCNFVRSTFDYFQLKGKVINRSILDSHALKDLNQFDCAVAIGSLHHTGDLALALKNLESLIKPEGRVLVMIYNYAQPKRILYNPVVFISNAINVALNKTLYFEEKNRLIRKASDKNLKGDPAPITTYSSRKLFLNRKNMKYSYTLKNSHKIGLKKVSIPRNFVLKYLSQFIGTDIYARGKKLR
jgi:SAM-dependent methyltransferase